MSADKTLGDFQGRLRCPCGEPADYICSCGCPCCGEDPCAFGCGGGVSLISEQDDDHPVRYP